MLISSGRVLEDGKTLSDYDIKPPTIIALGFKTVKEEIIFVKNILKGTKINIDFDPTSTVQ